MEQGLVQKWCLQNVNDGAWWRVEEVVRDGLIKAVNERILRWEASPMVFMRLSGAKQQNRYVLATQDSSGRWVASMTPRSTRSDAMTTSGERRAGRPKRQAEQSQLYLMELALRKEVGEARSDSGKTMTLKRVASDLDDLLDNTKWRTTTAPEWPHTIDQEGNKIYHAIVMY
jgi:hypothetical protein